MDLQQQQLQQLSDWLTQTEERIRNIETEPPAKDVEIYKDQIEQHKVNPIQCLSCMDLANEELIVDLRRRGSSRI